MASSFPGCPILSESLDEALVDLPQEKFPVIEQFVRFASGALDPDAVSQEDREAISDFLHEFERSLGQDSW